jgi:hypothetical protein
MIFSGVGRLAVTVLQDGRIAIKATASGSRLQIEATYTLSKVEAANLLQGTTPQGWNASITVSQSYLKIAQASGSSYARIDIGENITHMYVHVEIPAPEMVRLAAHVSNLI